MPRRGLLARYRDNWRALRRAAVGAELEQWPYEALDRDAEEQPPLRRRVGDAKLEFWIDRWHKASNGDLTICIDAKGLPTLLGVKPSYQFAKRPDGSTYYP